MNKLYYISDIHLERYTTFPRFTYKPGKYLAICGDLGDPFKKNYKQFLQYTSYEYEKVFIIPGNHEYYHKKKILIKDVDDKIKNEIDPISNVYFIKNKIIDVDDYKIGGCVLWSDNIVLNEENIHNNELSSINIKKMHNDDVKWIKNIINKNNKYIIMTHYLPSFQLIIPYFRKYRVDRYASNLEHLIKSPIKNWICGHSHCIYNKIINGVYCGINSVGYIQRKTIGKKHKKYIEL